MGFRRIEQIDSERLNGKPNTPGDRFRPPCEERLALQQAVELGRGQKQRAALLQMTWDHVGSALDHREHVFELHANGGEFAWRSPPTS